MLSAPPPPLDLLATTGSSPGLALALGGPGLHHLHPAYLSYLFGLLHASTDARAMSSVVCCDPYMLYLSHRPICYLK